MRIKQNTSLEEKTEKVLWTPGMTSVTFRKMGRREIVSLAKKAGLSGIEWGGDIHVPPGNWETAREAGNMTRGEGLKVLSYGSYFRLGRGEDILPVLETAGELGAKRVRIWAGEQPPGSASEEYWKRAVEELRLLCDKAKKHAISLHTEYHRGTLTQTKEGALRLLKEANCENLFTYWQPNPDISHRENQEELKAVNPFLSSVHVFCWKGKDVRYPLEEGKNEWREYLRWGAKGRESACILEFVKDDSPEQFLQDAKCLLELLQEEN